MHSEKWQAARYELHFVLSLGNSVHSSGNASGGQSDWSHKSKLNLLSHSGRLKQSLRHAFTSLITFYRHLALSSSLTASKFNGLHDLYIENGRSAAHQLLNVLKLALIRDWCTISNAIFLWLAVNHHTWIKAQSLLSSTYSIFLTIN